MTEQGIFPDIGFDHIAQFINPEGIPAHEVKTLRHNLRRLFNQTRGPISMWQPGFCVFAGPALKQARRFFGPDIRLYQNTEITHIWYQLASQSGEIVIDPAGMPKNEELFRELAVKQKANPLNKAMIIAANLHSYEPYFGRLDRTPIFRQQVYSSGKPCDPPAIGV